MATQDSGESHPASSEDTKAGNRLVGVLRASRMKAAVPLGNDEAQEAVIQGQGALIEAYQGQNKRLEHGPTIPYLGALVETTVPAILKQRPTQNAHAHAQEPHVDRF